MKLRTLGLTVAVSVAFTAAVAGQKVVARVKVHNPGEEMADAVVRGTLPLPSELTAPTSRLALRDGEKVLPTQVSVFSIYARADDQHPVGRPEVVQLAARTSLPARSFKELDVVIVGSEPAISAGKPGEKLAGRLARGVPVVVEATDCFGNRYRAAALGADSLVETRQSGPVLTERVHQAILVPAGAAEPGKPALKKFLRVRAYLTTYAGEDFASLALMIHNGSIDHPNGMVYYRSIRVGVAQPLKAEVWQQRLSPAAEARPSSADGCTWIDCPPADPNGKVFAMPHGGAAVLRLSVYTGDDEGRAERFARHAPIFVPVPSQTLWSWSNYQTARYDATKWPMPLMLAQGALAKVDAEVKGYLSKPWDLEFLFRGKRSYSGTRTLGHALPAGVHYGGMTGGVGVNYVFGVSAAVTGHNGRIWLHVLQADRNWDRHRGHWFYDDGKPFIYGRHVQEVNGVKMVEIPLDRHHRPTAGQPAYPACGVQAGHVGTNDLLAPQAKNYLKYMDHDDQHLSRVFDAVPAAYLACDPLNRDRLVTLGTQACLKRNIHPFRRKPNFGGWGSIFGIRKSVDARPHAGIGVSREHGWVAHTLGWAFSLSQDRQIRADCIEIAKADVYIRAKAQMPGGNVTLRAPSNHAFKKGYWWTSAWEEGGILADGARSVVSILDAPETAESAEQMRQVYRAVGKWTVTAAWDDRIHSPGFRVGLRRAGEATMLEKPVTAYDCTFYMGTPLAWYHELTGERIYLDRLREMAGGPTLSERCMKQLGNWSYALWLAQGGTIPVRD